jgi:hypothetical protein
MLDLLRQLVRRAVNVASETSDPVVVALCTTLVHCSGGVVISKRSLCRQVLGAHGRCSPPRRCMRVMSQVVLILMPKQWATGASTPPPSSPKVAQDDMPHRLSMPLFEMGSTIGFFHRKMN